MKPLLRVVLVIDALLLLAGGVLFVLTPWTWLYDVWHLVQIRPVMAGQIFGIALLGLAWLAFHAAFNGKLTTAVARAIGHVNWITAVVMAVWLIALHQPEPSAFGQLVTFVLVVVLFVVGLGGVRLAATVRKRERLKAFEAKTGAAGSVAASSAQPAPVVVPPQPHPAATSTSTSTRVEPSVGTVGAARPATGSGTAPSPTYAAPSGTSAATPTSSATTDASIRRDPPIHG